MVILFIRAHHIKMNNVCSLFYFAHKLARVHNKIQYYKLLILVTTPAGRAGQFHKQCIELSVTPAHNSVDQTGSTLAGLECVSALV